MRRQGEKKRGRATIAKSVDEKESSARPRVHRRLSPFLRHPGPDPLRIVFRCVPFFPPGFSRPFLASLCCSTSQRQLVRLPFEPFLISQLQCWRRCCALLEFSTSCRSPLSPEQATRSHRL